MEHILWERDIYHYSQQLYHLLLHNFFTLGILYNFNCIILKLNFRFFSLFCIISIDIFLNVRSCLIVLIIYSNINVKYVFWWLFFMPISIRLTGNWVGTMVHETGYKISDRIVVQNINVNAISLQISFYIFQNIDIWCCM